MLPVLNEVPPSEVAVCVVPSWFFHATVCPTVMITGFGEYELLPFIPTMFTVTSAAGPPGCVGLESLLQPRCTAAASRIKTPARSGDGCVFIGGPPLRPLRGVGGDAATRNLQGGARSIQPSGPRVPAPG